MKYAAFLAMLAAGVPVMAMLASSGRAGRRVVLALLVISPMVGWMSKINFMSMEEYRGPDRGFEVTLTDLLAASLAASVLLERNGRIAWIPRNAVPLLAYFAISCAGLLFTPSVLISSFALFKLARCGFLYWVVVNAVREEDDVRGMVAGWTIAGLMLAAVVAYQKYVGGIYRAPGTFDHSNTIPLYLNLVIGAVLAWSVAGGAGALSRWAGVASVLGMLFCVVSTVSRAGILLSMGCLAATALLVLARSPSRWGVSVLALGALVCAAGSLRAYDTVTNRFTNAPPASEAARDEFNVAARMMSADHPLGVGINAFTWTLTGRQEYRRHLIVMANERQAGVAHHIYLLTLSEQGYPGLLAFLLVMLRFLWIALAAARRPASRLSVLAGALLVGMIGVHLAGFLEWALRITPVAYQLVLVAGLAVALDAMPRCAATARVSSASSLPTNRS